MKNIKSLDWKGRLKMEELKLKYYFEHMDEFSEKEIFEDCEYVWEPLNKTKEYLNKKIVEPNILVKKFTIF